MKLNAHIADDNGCITPSLLVYSCEQPTATSQMCLTFWRLCHRSCSKLSHIWSVVFFSLTCFHSIFTNIVFIVFVIFRQCRVTVYTKACYSSTVFFFFIISTSTYQLNALSRALFCMCVYAQSFTMLLILHEKLEIQRDFYSVPLLIVSYVAIIPFL